MAVADHEFPYVKRVYIETSIPSFYVETRQEPDMIARREWTREWWDKAQYRYEIVTSAAVIEELSKGDYPNKTAAIDLISHIPLLPIVDAVESIANAYIKSHVMPDDSRGDALHLAVASHYGCHFLLTWNCRHLANANKFEHIRYINSQLGLFSPILTTPFELLESEGE